MADRNTDVRTDTGQQAAEEERRRLALPAYSTFDRTFLEYESTNLFYSRPSMAANSRALR